MTERKNGKPRFLTFPTFAALFGNDQRIGLVQALTTPRMVLAPRLMKHGNAADAEFGEGDVTQAGSLAVLLDQAGHVVFYNIIVNKTFADFIKKKGLNKIDTLSKANPTLEVPVGAIEMKAAWQIVDPGNPPKDRVTALAKVPRMIVNGDGKLVVAKDAPLRDVTVALIGLHVVIRTKGHPEMIWATFEFDRNAPSTQGNQPMLKTNCVNASEPVSDVVMDDGKEYLLYRNGTVFANANLIPRKFRVVDADAQTFEADPPTSIVRVFPFSNCSPARRKNEVKEIDGAIVAVNGSAKSQIREPERKSYSLIGAIWLDDPRNPNEGLGFEENQSFEDFQFGGERRLSSTSMESFTQLKDMNCFACHDTTQKAEKLDAKRINVSHIFRRLAKASEQ
jgi:hypothetical protein